ncbi:hypothetical protein AB7102_14400 [Providencia manganoxydans]|uniref:hypothetical protein n=1 Tax=Providencia manganoxydans TaxID=2923283 RepID=UPI0034E545F1
MEFTNLNELIPHLSLIEDGDTRLFVSQKVDVIEVTESDIKIRWNFIIENGMDIHFQYNIIKTSHIRNVLEHIKYKIKKTLTEENRIQM